MKKTDIIHMKSGEYLLRTKINDYLKYCPKDRI